MGVSFLSFPAEIGDFYTRNSMILGLQADDVQRSLQGSLFSLRRPEKPTSLATRAARSRVAEEDSDLGRRALPDFVGIAIQSRDLAPTSMGSAGA
jgi:hypothetical protein